MRIAWVSKTCDSLSVAHRVHLEGHDLTFFVDDDAYREARVGEGLVPLGPKPTLAAIMAQKPELVVFDMVGYGELAGALRSAGVQVFGASLWADVVELNRSYGQALMAAIGVKTPKAYAFKSFDEARAFIAGRGKDRRWVFKPSGNLATHTTYVSQGRDDLLAILDSFAGKDVPEGTEFLLQEFVEGVEVSCEGWWDGTKWADPFNITFEEKRFMNGGLGPNTGCSGNVVIPITGRPRLVREGIGRLEEVLRRSDYRGPVDLNQIVTEDGIYGLEWTPRFGYDAIQALLTGMRGEIGHQLYWVATGQSRNLKLIYEYLIGVRLTVPPYPHGQDYDLSVPVLGITDAVAPFAWPTGVRADAGKLIGCAPDGNLLTITAYGPSVRNAQKRLYERVRKITIPNVQYRTDIGDRVDRDLGLLRQWGWV